MTVAELIEQLKDMPQDAIVWAKAGGKYEWGSGMVDEVGLGYPGGATSKIVWISGLDWN